MRAAGLRGVVRGRKVFNTRGDDRDQRPEDLVQRRFSAAAPNRLWVADLTYVRTWAGFCYVAFVVDVYSRMIVGWATSSTMRTEDLPLVALETAAWARVGSLDQLIHHSDRGSQLRFKGSLQQWLVVRLRVGDRSGLRRGCAIPASCGVGRSMR